MRFDLHRPKAWYRLGIRLGKKRRGKENKGVEHRPCLRTLIDALALCIVFQERVRRVERKREGGEGKEERNASQRPPLDFEL